MNTTVLPKTYYDTNTDDKDLEIFTLVWFDINNNEDHELLQKLRSIITHVIKFDDKEQCQQYIEQRTEKDRLILIISDQMGRELVSSIHKFRHVISVYVYCMEKEKDQEWTFKYNKVKAVVVTLDELISQIEINYKIEKKVEEPLSINIFTTTTNIEFVFSQTLIHCLLRLKSAPSDINELIDYCKNKYKENDHQLNIINEFEQEYSSDNVLWWFTRETFFCKLLNEALHKSDIHMIFLLRKFIDDIHDQLEKYQTTEQLTVYRGQLISNDELTILKENVGQFISINSFLSTTIYYDEAISLLKLYGARDGLEKVLFEIDADPKIGNTKPFAVVPYESNVLFMLGSIFRLESIYYNDDKIWVIRMTLSSDDEDNLKEVLAHMKQQIENEEINLRTLGNLLLTMGKFDLAEKYFIRMSNQLSPDDPLLSDLYEDLAKVAGQKCNYHMSVQWHRKSLALKNKVPSTVDRVSNQTNQSIEQIIPYINVNYEWKQDGITVAGGNGNGNRLHQFHYPYSCAFDNDYRCLYIADFGNHRIMKWKLNVNMGQVIAGGNGQGDQTNQFNSPGDLIIDKNNNCLIICDQGNRRVVQWSRQNGTYEQTIISNIRCFGIAIDNNGDLYVSNWEKHEVRRWKRGETTGTIVAGGNGEGDHLNQFSNPAFIFVDQDYSIYVSDHNNDRVMKWMKDTKEGTVVAGGNKRGNKLTQLAGPCGVIVDYLGNVYVADSENHRVMCWSKGSQEGRIIVGGNGEGQASNQLHCPYGLSFDRDNNLYVVDHENSRIQRFDMC